MFATLLSAGLGLVSGSGGLGAGIRGRAQEEACTGAATKAQDGKDDRKNLAHDQNGSKMSAACWP